MSGDSARSDEHAELLRAVHDAHGPALTRYVLRLTNGDTQFAEDVVQESLLRLWKKPDVLEQPSESARAWLFYRRKEHRDQRPPQLSLLARIQHRDPARAESRRRHQSGVRQMDTVRCSAVTQHGTPYRDRARLLLGQQSPTLPNTSRSLSAP